jgi:hypothetical protein
MSGSALKTLLVLIMSTWPLQRVLASENYKCTVTKFLHQKFPIDESKRYESVDTFLSDGSTGFLANILKSTGQAEADDAAALYVGKSFWVDRRTGKITGDFSSESYAEHKIINKGSQEWSFTVFIEGHPGNSGERHLIFLEVQQYARSYDKPFVAIGMTVGSGVLTGICDEGY